MSDAALRSVSIPAANLAVWLRAVLRYGLAQRRGLPTGLLLRQVEATLAREQARLGQFQFQTHDLLEQTLSLTKKLEDAHASYGLLIESINQVQCGKSNKWPMKSALLTPMHMWTNQLQVTSPSQMSLSQFSLHPHHMSCFLCPSILSPPHFPLGITLLSSGNRLSTLPLPPLPHRLPMFWLLLHTRS